MFYKLQDNAKIPTKAHPTDAGFDISSNETFTLQPGATKKVSTGIRMDVPINCFAGVYSRSGLSLNKGLVVLQGVGVIDHGYMGEIFILLHNCSSDEQTVVEGDRIAQIILQPLVNTTTVLVTSTRGNGGFGSTGV